MHTRRVQGAFTLLELLITLAVAGILVTVGIPGFRNMILDNRLANEANELVTSVNLARSAAVRFQRPATLCVSTSFDQALPSCSPGSDWANGWIVWVDKDRDDVTDGNEILAVREPMYRTSSVTAVTGRLNYDARGFSTTGGDDFVLCDTRNGETGRLVSVNNVGRTHVSAAVCT